MTNDKREAIAVDDPREPGSEGAVEHSSNSSSVDPIHQPRAQFDLKKDAAKAKSNKQIGIIIACCALFFVIVLVVLWMLVASAWDSQPEKVDETLVKADPGLVAEASEDNAVTKWKEAQAKKEAEEALRAAREKEKADRDAAKHKAQPAQASPPAHQAPAQGTAKAADAPPSPMDRKLGSGVVATVTTMPGSGYGASSTGRDSGNRPGQSTPGGSPAGDGNSPLSGGGGGAGSRGALSSLGSTSFAPTKAYLAPDGKYLLRNNSYARCALYTEVITEHESLLSCFLVNPLYSSDGSTLLADAGARMTGEQRIEMKPGQAQVFTQWNDLEVESGQPGVPNVRVRFDALGTGPMGSSGTKGWIDNKYLDRYGGAIVLSGFKDLLQAFVNSTQQGGDSGYTINNSEQNVEDIASKTLDANININPVGYLLPGTVINVTIARDIDFSTVYENR